MSTTTPPADSSAECARLAWDWVDSPIGWLRVAASARGLRRLEFHDTRSGAAATAVRDPHLEQARRELQEYFAGTRRQFDVALDYQGTRFQCNVWRALQEIAYGERISYLDQTRRVGDEKAIRAVAQANGQNPIAIIVPCHRVVYANGGLGGFGGGRLRKQYLLDLERGDRLL